MTKADSERKKIYSNQPNLGNNKGIKELIFDVSRTWRPVDHGIKDKRKFEYGSIGDQLDEIYKDIDAWKARVKKVKDDNPKE